jgi:hypothetical protein
MKLFYAFTAVCITATASAQFKLNAGYSLGSPQQEMNRNINLLHSIAVGGTYQLPGVLKRIEAGVDFSWGTYANESKKQTFTFRDGSSTRTRVNYSSNVLQFGLNTRVKLLTDKKAIPYVSGKLGYASFYSNIFIEDPDDLDGCRALDQSNIIKDGTFTAGYGGGLLLDWSLFCKREGKGKKWIDISVHNIRGNNINYINTKKLYDAANPPTGSDSKPLNVQFVNATTNEIHEHQVAEVFNTPMRMLEIKVSAVFAL